MPGDSFVYKHDRPWPNPRLKLAAIVGHTTATTTRLWFRTAREGDFTAIIYPVTEDPDEVFYSTLTKIPFGREDFPDFVKMFSFTASYRSDTTHVVDIEGLAPGTEYRYALWGQDAGGAGSRILLGHTVPYRFRTLPDAADENVSFGFFSCHMPYHTSLFAGTRVVNMEMWSYLEATLERHYQKDLRFVIAGGDQVYVDGVDTLDIWSYLRSHMKKEGGELFPDKEAMISWYRDIYRGYWGFPVIRRLQARYPTYMIWDDHELKDGWGSFYFGPQHKNELHEIFDDYEAKGFTSAQCYELLARMEEAGKQVYEEYQHSHNPKVKKGQYDYSFTCGKCAFFVLDGRGHRNINNDHQKILGQAQFDRFVQWAEALDVEKTPYVFVISAVPVLHIMKGVIKREHTKIADITNIQDDLRDAWEHPLHDHERRALLKVMFGLAEKGFKPSFLSGDVHVSAVFRMVDSGGHSIYQLTSSAITYA